MSDLAPRPRSATEIVDAAFQLYRKSPGQLILATAMIYAPWLVIQLVLMNAIGFNPATAATGTAGVGLVRNLEVVYGFALAGLVVYALVDAALTRIASELYLGRELDAVDALRSVGRRFGVFLAIALLRVVVLVVAFILLFFPAVYAYVRMFAVIPSAVIEGVGIGKSFRRSSTLSVGVKWHILLTMLLVWIILLILTFGAGILTKGTGSFVLQSVVGTVITVLVYPLVGLAQTVLYYDTRIRREGYDIELMAAMNTTVDVPGQTPV